jgi:cellulose synthase/poly-beta-1,6-N-acetylglucosamine synthase-like glycosyltransferase
VYLAPAAMLAGHAILQVWLWRAARRSRPAVPPVGMPLPTVTVQLPVYNERYVVKRLLDAVANLRYPVERLEIQVLDDSTDVTTSIVAERLGRLRAAGLRVRHIRRATRNGFKAGALANGLAVARGELVALFDADALPRPDFLYAAIPHFADPRVGVVQGRWAHVNTEQAWLTRVQALMLDVHFSVEQPGRWALGCFVNFNGTAGVWRAAAIRDAGGWSAATLTEDLDLSYRAQLRGWRFVYRSDLEVPAELPADLHALRMQHYRWMKGVAENARRLLPPLVRARLRPVVRIHACAHLLEASLYPAILLQLSLAVPVAVLAVRGALPVWLALNPLALLSFVVLAPVYHAPFHGRPLSFFVRYVGFLLLTLGLALHYSLAVAAGIAGRRSPFFRTPKRGGRSDAGVYHVQSLDRHVPVELAAWVVLGVGLLWTAAEGALLIAWLPLLAFMALTAVLAMVLVEACRRPASAAHARDGGDAVRPVPGERAADGAVGLLSVVREKESVEEEAEG